MILSAVNVASRFASGARGKYRFAMILAIIIIALILAGVVCWFMSPAGR